MKLKELLQSIKFAWQRRKQVENADREQFTDFLPAALEILEKPPSPAGRWLGVCLIGLFSIAILWAIFGKVDIVATAEGKIIPGDRVKLIQPMQMGVISAIFVSEGEYVQKNQPLMELDQTLTGADRRRLQSEIRFLSINAIREMSFGELLKNTEKSLNSESAVQLAILEALLMSAQSIGLTLSESEKSMQLAMVDQKWRDYRNQSDILHSQYQNKLAELESIDANIKKYQSTLPLIGRRVNALQTLSDDGLIAETQLLELQEQLINQQQSLAFSLAQKNQVQAAASEVLQLVASLDNRTRKENLETLEGLQKQLHVAQEEWAKADELYAKQILASPVAGRVKQLAVHTIGGVVKEAQVLMQIVPEERFLEVEALLQNKDIGFIHTGQKAEVKIHTFPFTKYGVMNANVVDITADAIDDEKQGLVYKVRLKMDGTQLFVDSQWVDLLPGMSVTAEVKTSKRRLIEFFLSPLLRYKDESVRER
ncbi:HlyD family type I secretion periplasmic adaptor subunit [Saccharophagus degradans]|uniref:Membrane fusion protein (MFP) family protein n=1 Tax=Saccharophagus degradans TaxID=86304 RepID=A0AAW7X2W6_9GAMM|nr:HlyD family type I secretion periplasmic adaptor subunit [Saccharophagus degradans]MDO6422130.1 HlyD family type I secretion periplasmic adaptor subunit [Saccharophagus degradans]MDO6609315.1 HlyD family type I secretion periplasmic adaptor subunit [Saccharophagus degradans]